MRGVILFLSTAGLLCAQLANNTLTVQASRTVYAQPDQVVFTITVASGTDAVLDDIVAELHGTGITADNLIGVSQGTSEWFSSVQWTFNLAVPLAKIADTAASLTALHSNDTITFEIQGTQLSPVAQAAQQCKQPDLVADATAQAKKLAAAAGLTIGPILAISNAAPSPGIPVAAVLTGGFAQATLSLISSPFFLQSSFPACSLAVEFALQP